MSLWSAVGTDIRELRSAEEAMRSSGLSWVVKSIGIPRKMPFITERVYKKPTFASQNALEAAENSPLAGNILCRSTDKEVLHIHGPNYTAVQNKELFDVAYGLSSRGIALPAYAGSLRDRTVWIYLEANQGSERVGEQSLTNGLLLFNSHDDQTSYGFAQLTVVDDEVVLDGIVKRYQKLIPGEVDRSIEIIEAASIQESFEELCEVHRKAHNEVAVTANICHEMAKKLGDLHTPAAEAYIDNNMGDNSSLWELYYHTARYLSCVRGSNSEGTEGNRLSALWFGDSSRALYKVGIYYQTQMDY